MEFTFSIRGALREAWALFKKHVWFFVALSAVMVVLNIVGNGKHVHFLVMLIAGIASFIWSIVIMKFALLAADGKEEGLSLNTVQAMLPSWQQALAMAGVGLLVGVLVLCGLILLIIPGLWVAFRLSVANYAYLDKGEGVRKAVRASWEMTKGPAFWTAVLVGIVAGGLYLIGLVFFGVGILVTYPLAMILMAKFYRALVAHHGGNHAVVVQSPEIVAPEHKEMHHESEMPQ